jgi:hypothetical protein
VGEVGLGAVDLEQIKLIGQGGIFVALITLIYFVGMKLVSAIDKIGDKLDAHTKTDVEHHGEVKEAIVRVEAKLDARSGAYRQSLAVVRNRDNE